MKLRTTHYFIIAYIICALFGTIFFKFYSCGYFNSSMPALNLIDISSSFQLIDQTSSCPVRRKVSIIYMLFVVYLFLILASVDYFINRDFYLNDHIVSLREEGTTHIRARYVFSLFFFIFFLFFNYFTFFFLFPSDMVDEISRSDLRLYGDDIYSFLVNFTIFLPIIIISMHFILVSFDLAFLNSRLYKDI